MKEQQIQDALLFSIRLMEEYAPSSGHIQTLEAMLKPEPTNIKDWLTEWIEIWPTKGQVEADSGRRWSYGPKVTGPKVMERMKTFLKNFNSYCPTHKHLTHEERLDAIFDATIRYVEDRRVEKWDYTKKSIKFIYDTDGSILANYIEGKNEKKPRNNFDYTI